MQDVRARLLQAPRRDLETARRDRSTNVRPGSGCRGRPSTTAVPRICRCCGSCSDKEIVRYREVVPWGVAADLELAGLLLAEHRQLRDVWLHWQAKQISFDTALGYRTYHLLTAGIAATVAAIEASDHPDRERVLREITGARDRDGTPRFTDVVVDEWLAAQRTRFPDDPNAEDPRAWANHAARLGDRDASRRFILL